MYKTWIDNEDIEYTRVLFPWVIKPLWSPFIDMYATKESGFSHAIIISIAFYLWD
jgi:PAT family beta-lactamase induction signal transducer AmpG